MTKLISLLITLVTYFSFLGQSSISEIKSSSTAIKGKMSLTRYEQDDAQKKRLIALINNDVIGYFNLSSQFDSDLKKKMYMQSEEYQSKLKEFKEIQANELQKNYYLDFEPTYYERNYQLKYQLSSKSFSITNEIYLDEKNQSARLQFDNLVFSTVQGMKITYSTFESGGIDFGRQIISFIVNNESTALKIEENRQNLKFLFQFKLVSATKFTNNVIGAWEFDDYLINCKVLSVIIYNSSTNEILHTYATL